MKVSVVHSLRSTASFALAALAIISGSTNQSRAILAPLLFQDDFSGGIPGWTAIMPVATYVDGPMLWQFDKVNNAFSEQSNLYTENATAPPLRRACMLISDAAGVTNFAFKARLTSGDNDAFGLIWGYENDGTFYRLEFSQQAGRVAWPNTGWAVDRMTNNAIVDVAVNTTPFVLTLARPFDVTIAVTNGFLTLTVDDDPLGSPVHYDLLINQALPSSGAGKVGLFSWGQAGATPRSFRIQNPVLNGVALDAAAITQVLSNWSFTITPSSTNDYPNDTGLWSQALGPNGDRGVMIENNDSAPENVASSYTNCPVNAATAGDVNWSNYVYSVRFKSADNDGFGAFLRWQNRTNWYRIAFRNQSTAAGGIRLGTSVQKNVNRTFDQMLSTTAFTPPINTAFDMHASIRTNTLQIICVVNPDSNTPTVTTFAPINMAASTKVPANLATGKIGVFSWAQYGDNNLPDTTAPDDGTAVDFVKVRSIVDEGLIVQSAFGTPDPPAGLNDLTISQLYTARVDSAVSSAPGVRQLSIGWTGSGSVPGTGATNQVIFTLTQLSFISWKWQTQYLLTLNSTAGGTAVGSLGPWINPGSNVTVTATANPGFVFTGWTGDSLSLTSVLSLQMTRPYTLTANFAPDSDGDGLPDSWEMLYFGNLSQNAAGDPDGDGNSNLVEYQLGTNPNFAENTVLADGMTSRWVNEFRDRSNPGWFANTDFGFGFKGVWETSNQNRGCNSAGPEDVPFITVTNYGTNSSFQGPYIVVRSNVWNPAWATAFSLSAEYSVGDNDGNCLYFRYLDRSNWFRVTVCGDDAAAATRPFQGLSVQSRTNGYFQSVPLTTVSGNPSGFWNDERDTLGWKRFRITVSATNDVFEVRVIGYSVLLDPNDWDPASEVVWTFTDGRIPTGRIGFGPWGQGAGRNGFNTTTNDPQNPGMIVNPVGSGMFADNITLKVDGTNAFLEDWESAPVHTTLPTGWDNPYVGVSGLQGDWHQSAHGTIANFTLQFGTPQTGTTEFPKADGEGPMLLAPAITNKNYELEVGIHPGDDGGMGLVYDFVDTNNFARVMFNSQIPVGGDMLQGVNISRKSGGVWTNIVVGDSAFVYVPGRPMDVRFANNNGNYSLSVSYVTSPDTVYTWKWSEPQPASVGRVGVAIWDMPDAHFTYFNVKSLPVVVPPVPFKITRISLSGGNVVLDVSKPAGSNYHVLRATDVLGPYVTNAANQSGAQYSEPASGGATYYYRLQLLP